MELTVSRSEVEEKDRRIRAFLAERGLDALLFSTTANFAWAACGRDNHVAKGTDAGAGHALYTADGNKYLLCDNIEEPRLREEERLEEQGFQFRTAPWHAWNLSDLVWDILGSRGARLASDLPNVGDSMVQSANALAPLRFTLTREEQTRYTWLGRVATEALETTGHAIDAGMSEHEVGAVLDHFLQDEGATPHLTLVAADERIARFRHPIPTAKKVERYVMFVTGAKAFGLIVCATRLVHFGPLPDDLRRRHEATCYVDAVFNLSTTPGAEVGAIFARAQAAYAEQGFGDEWRYHHQGGATGYTGRDYRATPDSKQIVQPNQPFAWNPSIAGTKSEDTIIATVHGPALLTQPLAWPVLHVQTPYGTMDRPAILER
jgi:antitoxin VapB